MRHKCSTLRLPDETWDAGLDPELTGHDPVDALIVSIPEPHLTVDFAVGNVRSDSPDPVQLVV